LLIAWLTASRSEQTEPWPPEEQLLVESFESASVFTVSVVCACNPVAPRHTAAIRTSHGALRENVVVAANPEWMSGVQQFPDFSPDSRRLAYAVEDPTNGLSSLYIQDIESNTPVKLTSRGRYESRPVWSPDGHPQNKLLRLKDGHLQSVLDDDVRREYPAFSPDGAHIAYSSDRTGQDQLWASDRDGHGEFLVSANAAMKTTRPM